MKNLNYKRIVPGLLFLALAGFSCYWTAESLYLLMPMVTRVGAWLIAAVFYIVASLCFSKILKTLDRNEDFFGKFGGRGGQFLLGLLGLIVFWLVISMPTNTHTLFYRSSIVNVLKTDLLRTQGYLRDLQENNIEIKKEEIKYEAYEKACQDARRRMEYEIENPSAYGVGPNFKKILGDLQTELNTTIQLPNNTGTNKNGWRQTIDYCMRQADKRLAELKEDRDKNIARIKQIMNSPELSTAIENLGVALYDIENMKGIDHDKIDAANKDLITGYSLISADKEYIDIKDDIQRERYTREKPITEVDELLKVSNVWMDFLTTKKYEKHAFFWWILIALMVDLSAFIFFDIAFSKKHNNAID